MASSICPVFARSLVGDVLDLLLADVMGNLVAPYGAQVRENDRWIPLDSRIGERKPG